MTESDWRTSSDPAAMIQLATGRVSERQLRLFAAACFHARYGRLLGPHSSWESWESGERGENQLSPIAEASSWVSNPVHAGFRGAFADILRDIVGDPCSPYRVTWAGGPIRTLALAAWDGRDPTTGQLDPLRLAVLADALEEAGCVGDDCYLCDQIGRRWFCHRCRGIYTLPADTKGRCPFCPHHQMERRDCELCNGMARLPHPLLAHLRSPGPHVRGCWGLDAALGHLAINPEKD